MNRTRRYSFASIVFVLSFCLLPALRAEEGAVYSPELASLQAALAASGTSNVALDQAEIMWHAEGYDAASPHILIANNRTHLLSSQFVENDPRRGGSGDISYLVDQSEGSALSWNSAGAVVVLPNAVTEPQLDASMSAWTTVNCNGPGVVKVPDSGADPDLIDGLVFGNPVLIGTPFADITHAGWLPRQFFDAIAPPNGSAGILGVTFTFIFVNADGSPTDVDQNGRADVAFREIYYNARFPWGTGGNPRNVDIQSVAIHEAGHAFGLAHFGKVSLLSNGNIQYSPKAIMNAVYVEEDRRILGTDTSSFCAIWANSH